MQRIGQGTRHILTFDIEEHFHASRFSRFVIRSGALPRGRFPIQPQETTQTSLHDSQLYNQGGCHAVYPLCRLESA